MSESDPNDDGLEARLRWFAQQISRSVEHLEELDISFLARAAGVDADRAREWLDEAKQWIASQADNVASEAGSRFGDLFDAATQAPDAPASPGPHPLDVPTEAQGKALSAIDSGRWSVEPGSHVIVGNADGPAPADALDLVGELRARDWINADGAVTVIGHNALTRWVEQAGAG